MMERIAVFSRGLMQLSDELRHLSGLDPKFAMLSAKGSAAVAGWGHKPTAARARAVATRSGLPYIAFEDGFLRALRPGPAQRPLSMVMDRTGIYYDARQPSGLENILETQEFDAREIGEAKAVVGAIASQRLSKYNHGKDQLEGIDLPPGQPVVLVIDQTAGDELVSGGLADANSFERMVEAAVTENPGAVLIAKLHPETLAGTKPGYIEASARRHGLQILAQHVSPWSLFDLKPHVYTVTSQFGFEALLAACKVTCFGMPFYAGWGLTDDRITLARRTRQRSTEEIAAAVFLRYCHYFDAWRRTPVDAMTAIDQLGFLRRSFLSNTRPVIGYRIARWKRRAVSAMTDGPGGPPRFTSSLHRARSWARRDNATIAAWGADAIRMRRRHDAGDLPCTAIEDGFLRSVGLGAAFVQPLSLVFDTQGLYFDPTRPSDIEITLSGNGTSALNTTRARMIRERIIASRITKYNIEARTGSPAIHPDGKEVVLVPGQVADDAAVQIGRPPEFPAGENVNAVLLKRVRERHPDAYVIFKPHPDVEHLGRAGALGREQDECHADHIARNTPLDELFSIASHMETFSSLAGFEALLRGISVTVHGMPFYGGWGLTEDLTSCPRRNRHKSLDELVAAALIHYPRYWDPESGLVCPPEVALERLTNAKSRGTGSWKWLRMAMGRTVIASRRVRKLVLGARNEP